MKELRTNFKESEDKKENNFTWHFNIYECLNKWLEKPPWLINIKFYDVIVIDMFHKYRIRSLKVFL